MLDPYNIYEYVTQTLQDWVKAHMPRNLRLESTSFFDYMSMQRRLLWRGETEFQSDNEFPD